MGAKRSSYWAAVEDEPSARNAVRMAGLPVLLVGGAEALTALIAAIDTPPDSNTAISSAVVAVLLIIVAFRLRGGHAGWVPLVVLGFVILLALRVPASIAAWNAAGRNGIAVGTELLVGWIIPLLCLTLMLGGLRGWLWLRANGIRRGF